MAACPACKFDIPSRAVICGHCRTRLDTIDAPESRSPRGEDTYSPINPHARPEVMHYRSVRTPWHISSVILAIVIIVPNVINGSIKIDEWPTMLFILLPSYMLTGLVYGGYLALKERNDYTNLSR